MSRQITLVDSNVLAAIGSGLMLHARLHYLRLQVDAMAEEGNIPNFSTMFDMVAEIELALLQFGVILKNVEQQYEKRSHAQTQTNDSTLG